MPTSLRLRQLWNKHSDNRHYALQSTAQSATVWLYDVIGADPWGGISAATFARDLASLQASTIHLRINSPGGDVFDARAIATALREHPAHIIAHIDGLAASAASYIALAADEVSMSDGAFLMIHNAWGVVIGNRHDLLEMALTLEKIDKSIVQDYEHRTGQPTRVLQDWMDKESWFTAQEALDAGFIDRIDPTESSSDPPPPETLATARTDSLCPALSHQDRTRRLSVIERTA